MINIFQPKPIKFGELSNLFNQSVVPIAQEATGDITEGEALLQQVQGDISSQREVLANPFTQDLNTQDQLIPNEGLEAIELQGQDALNDPILPKRQSDEGDSDYSPDKLTTNGSFDPASFTFNKEARIRGGKLKVYKPPSGDGGGSFEVAGITQRYQPNEAKRLKRLISQGNNSQAIEEAKAFYRKRGAPFTKYANQKGLQLQLSDTVHHRGEGGLRKILQRATGMKTKSYASLIKSLDSRGDALNRFNKARSDYEWQEIDRGRASRVKFKDGLRNRFRDAHNAAKKANTL